MRISSQQAFNLGVQGIQRNYAETIRTQQQISTGNRILTPADDPVASVRLMQLEQQQSMLSQYKENLTAANNSLVQEESTLDTVNSIMQRIRELATKAGNGALSQGDRQSIAAELREREDELLGLMNTKNARGEYVFAGFQGKAQPFVREPDGSYSYQGDEGQRRLQIASSLTIPISDNGKVVFQDIVNAGRMDAVPDTSTFLPESTLRVSAPMVQDEIAFTGNDGFPAGGITIVFGDPNATPPGDAKSYEVYASPANPGVDTPLQTGSLDDDDKDHDSLVFRGMVVHFDGVPAGGESIAITEDDSRYKQGVLDSIQQLRKALEENPDSPEGNRATRDAVAIALTNIDNAMVTIDATRGDIGARMNIIETTQINNEDVSLVNQTVQAELREVDYPEALSRLAFQSIVLEAAQQSYVRISNISLFNRM